ncbi:MAG: ABC transporter permease [Thalassobaculales bacterium]
MAGYVLRRLIQALVAIIGVVTIVFVIQRLAGDPTLLMVPEGATREEIDSLRRALGLDRPIPVQFADYLGQLARLDLGSSLRQNVPVAEIIASRLPYTVWLALAALVVALGIGLPAGVIMAMRRGSRIERVLMGVVLVGQSMPTFWSGIMMILLFAVFWGVLPPSGADSPQSVLLPAVALGALTMATFARITRTAVLDELAKEYVRTAHAKGLLPTRVLLRHVMTNAAIPVVTIAALELANLLAGAVIVETVFAWPGLGQLAVQSIEARDFPIVQGVVLLGAATTVALNLGADLVYGAIDPRIRMDGSA